MAWKGWIGPLFAAAVIALAPGAARACVRVPSELDPIIYATTEHYASTEHLTSRTPNASQKPSVSAISLVDPYGMTSWTQGKTTGEYLFIQSHDKWSFVGGGAAHYSAADLVRLFRVPANTATALVDRFIKLVPMAASQLGAP